jgi:hypothetical protein
MNDIKYVIINVICFFMLSFGFVIQGSYDQKFQYSSESSRANDQYCSKPCCQAQAALEKKSQPGEFVKSLATAPSGFMQGVIGCVNGQNGPVDNVNNTLRQMNQRMEKFKATIQDQSLDTTKGLEDANIIALTQAQLMEAISEKISSINAGGCGSSIEDTFAGATKIIEQRDRKQKLKDAGNGSGFSH